MAYSKAMDAFLNFVLYFTFYAFLGWVWEFIFIYFVHHRLHWHGFLRIPILPIYGFSAVAILLLVQPYIDNPFYVFMAGALLVTLIEFFTGFVLDKVFHLRLWDYRELPLNIGGYTDLYTSLGFGMMSLFLVYVVQPWVSSGITSLSHSALLWIGWSIVAIITLDFANSLSVVVRTRIESARSSGTLQDIQKRLDTIASDMRKRRGIFRRFISEWQRRNLTWLRRAFPDAELTRRKK